MQFNNTLHNLEYGYVRILCIKEDVASMSFSITVHSFDQMKV